MIKAILKNKVTTIIACGVSLLNFLFYFAMRPVWSGISKQTIYVLPFILFFVYLGVMIATYVLALLKKQGKPMIAMLISSLVLIIGLGVILYLGGWDYIKYIFRHFVYGIIFTLIATFIIYLIFYYPNSKIKDNKAIKVSALVIALVAAIMGKLNIWFHYISVKPVVYAVEDEYQIVWSTSTDSIGYVEIDGKKYTDLFAGSDRSEDNVHKVCVPMSVLDEAKSYKIISKNMLYRGPFDGIYGSTIEETYSFSPVNLDDGLNYYVMSDLHENDTDTVKAASYFGDSLDFVVLNGDLSHYLDEIQDIEFANRVAHKITKGTKPVIYARGNHEVKGNAADELYRYVGSKNEKFYYSVYLNGVYAVVLDLGEDHGDTWWEYYNTAHFDDYRNEQTKYLESLIENKDETFNRNDIEYKMVICHEPITFSKHYRDTNGTDYFLWDLQSTWTSLLNEFDLNIGVYGHRHELFPLLPSDLTPDTKLSYVKEYKSSANKNVGKFTDASFPSFIVSRKTLVQSADVKDSDGAFTGLAVTYDKNSKAAKVSYTNSSLEKLHVISPFTGKDFGDEFVFVDKVLQ